MATDVSEYLIDCPCKRGKIHARAESPDHPWAKDHQTKTEYTWQCERCASDYLILPDYRSHLVVRRTEHEAREVARKAHREAEGQLMASAAFRQTAEEFARLLDQQRYVTDVYRLASRASMTTGAIGSFRKEWTSGTDWVRRHFHTYQIRRVLDILGQSPDRFGSELERVEQLGNAVPAVIPVLELK